MPATDPSRKCRFRRSLPQLGTACNLRFQRTFQRSLGAHAFLIIIIRKSMCPSRIRTFKRSLPQLGTPCNLRFQHIFQGSLGAHAFVIWEMSATDPSRKWSFRRSLPHLGTACNLRFFACIHTSAFIKKTLRKLDSIRSLLYEQLRRRPKHRFSQNYTLHTMHTQKHARTAQKTIFSPARKSRPRA